MTATLVLQQYFLVVETDLFLCCHDKMQKGLWWQVINCYGNAKKEARIFFKELQNSSEMPFERKEINFYVISQF
jgi:hypothetical protein